jgi:transposase InsO family protein
MNLRFEFIRAQKAMYPVWLLCRVLRVSRSGFYAWSRPERHQTETAPSELDGRLQQAFAASRARYGSRRLHQLLQAEFGVSRATVARHMRALELRARRKRPFVRTTDSRHDEKIEPNLVARDFAPQQPNQVWASDITYIQTDEGWLYLAVILDLWSRRVIGYATSRRIDRLLVLDALNMATGTRKPAEGAIHHSDRGSQYCSRDYRMALQAAGLTGSMSRKGDCWDNAPVESFFSTLKGEELNHQRFSTRHDAHLAVITYLHWYNAHRIHSTLGYTSPAHFEAQPRHPQLAA